ncbi:MAG: 50S ribosomal protein L11 methyltransferase [[Clostridium] leptum]
MAQRFTAVCGDLTDKVEGQYECRRHIVADVIIQLTQDIDRYMKPDAVYLMSGIIDTREQDVTAA